MRNDYSFWRIHIIIRPMPKEKGLRYSDRGIVMWKEDSTSRRTLDIYTRWGLLTIRLMNKRNG